MNEIKITESNVLNAYAGADELGKQLLHNLFGEEIFSSRNITDRVKSFEDILQEAGLSKADFEKSCEGLTKDEIAYRQLKLIAKVYNGDWKADWSNSDQAKWYPWFKYNQTGFGFSRTLCGFWYSHTGVGSRLCFASSELAEDAGKKFIDIYNDFLN